MAYGGRSDAATIRSPHRRPSAELARWCCRALQRLPHTNRGANGAPRESASGSCSGCSPPPLRTGWPRFRQGNPGALVTRRRRAPLASSVGIPGSVGSRQPPRHRAERARAGVRPPGEGHVDAGVRVVAQGEVDADRSGVGVPLAEQQDLIAELGGADRALGDVDVGASAGGRRGRWWSQLHRRTEDAALPRMGTSVRRAGAERTPWAGNIAHAP